MKSSSGSRPFSLDAEATTEAFKSDSRFASQVRDGFGGAGDGGRADGHDEAQIRMRAHQRGRLGLRLVLEVVAGADGDELDVRVGGLQARLDVLLPFALVGRGEGGDDHGELTFAVGQAGGFIHETLADAFGRGGDIDFKPHGAREVRQAAMAQAAITPSRLDTL